MSKVGKWERKWIRLHRSLTKLVFTFPDHATTQIIRFVIAMMDRIDKDVEEDARERFQIDPGDDRHEQL